MDLMAAQVAEFEKEFRVERHAAGGLGVELYHPAANSVGIELHVPGGVQGVGEIDATSVAAELDHLRTAVQCVPGIFRMRGAAHDSAQIHGAGFLGMKRIGDVILQKFACAPTRNVEEAIVERKIDIGDKRGHSLESLEQRRQEIGVGGF